MASRTGLFYTAAIIFVFLLAFLGAFYFRDPEVDLSKYDNVVTSYKDKIRELRVATRLVSGYLMGLREAEGVERLEALATSEGQIATPAKTVLFLYYSQPERYKCEHIETCPEMFELIPRSRSEKAFYWARQMTGEERANALAFLLRDTRIAPVATETDRIHLMTEAENNTYAGRKAATALGFHYLDKRYFKNDMIAESALWLERANEIDRVL